MALVSLHVTLHPAAPLVDLHLTLVRVAGNLMAHQYLYRHMDTIQFHLLTTHGDHRHRCRVSSRRVNLVQLNNHIIISTNPCQHTSITKDQQDLPVNRPFTKQMRDQLQRNSLIHIINQQQLRLHSLNNRTCPDPS